MSKSSKSSNEQLTSYEPVSPVDVVGGAKPRAVGFGSQNPFNRSRTSSSSSSLSLKTPRTPRFAEATSVNSPIDQTRSPFADPSTSSTSMADSAKGPKVSDVGFGYVADNDPAAHSSFPVEQYATHNGDAPKSPLKSALKSPGTPGRALNPLSPTFKEEQVLEKEEKKTEKQQAKDLKVKFRVRLAKMALRGINFSCSLIVLSLLAATFTIFNATKALPARNNLPAWAHGTNPWPQIVLLVIASISLIFCIGIFYAYWRGGHRRAEKAAVYYTVFSVIFFSANIIMWAVGAGILHQSKQHSDGKDLWGWACKDNTRRTLFQEDVHYGLVCRLQDWSLICCFIEIIVETITIAIYGVVFYRFYSKRKLHKSMDLRDRARSDLYLAQLRTQSAPNTPGFAVTPRTPYFPSSSAVNAESDAEEGRSGYYATQYVTPKSEGSVSSPKPFQLQPPPIKVHSATPKPQQDGFEPVAPPPPQERIVDHVGAAPGEQTYDAVPIPGAYSSPLSSPTFTPAHYGSMSEQMARGAPGQAM